MQIILDYLSFGIFLQISFTFCAIVSIVELEEHANTVPKIKLY